LGPFFTLFGPTGLLCMGLPEDLPKIAVKNRSEKIGLCSNGLCSNGLCMKKEQSPQTLFAVRAEWPRG
jgi:hypothetical protein